MSLRGTALLAVAGLVVTVACGCARSGEPVADTTTSSPSPTVTPSTATPTPRRAQSPAPTYRSLEEVYLLHNELYSAGQIPAVVCRLPEIALRTEKAVLRYSKAVLDCLQRSWTTVVERADIQYFPPTVYTVTQGTKTRCGIFGGEYEAYVMAHEFGHHVQQLVGISMYFDERWGQATGAARLEQMRRHELQASCFAAAFFGANQRTLDLYGSRLALYRWSAYAGDDDQSDSAPDHGSRKSNTAWAKAAFKAKSPAACNTWVVPAKRVS